MDNMEEKVLMGTSEEELEAYEELASESDSPDVQLALELSC